VMAGASIEKLKEILGHYSVVMTERYAHLRPDLFPASDLGTIRVDLFAGGAEVVQLRLKTGSSRRKAPRKGAEEKKNGRSRPVSRVLSPRPVARAGEADIPLGPALPRASSELTREHGGPPLPLEAALPYLLLLRVGLAVPPPSPAARCALAAPFHPCLPFGRRSVLCGAVPRVASAGRWPAPCPVVPGLSSRA